MKKTWFLIALFLMGITLYAQDPFISGLETYAENESNGTGIQYDLIGYEISNTIRARNVLDEAYNHLGIIHDNLGSEELQELIDLRNEMFEVSGKYSKEYENRIMHGDLRNSSAEVAELRLKTEIADSLIRNWDRVKSSGYEYNKLLWWYYAKDMSDDDELGPFCEEMYKRITSSKDKFDFVHELESMNLDEICGYSVIPKFFVHNPESQNENILKDHVFFSASKHYLGSARPTEEDPQNPISDPFCLFILLSNSYNSSEQESEATRTIYEDIDMEPTEEETIPFQLIEEKPSFMGGDANKFSSWVNSQLQYPDVARANGVQGRVILQFTVKRDGSISNVTVLRGVDSNLDAEAVRVVSSSPKWTPGKQKGQTVNVTYTFPVIFQLK